MPLFLSLLAEMSESWRYHDVEFSIYSIHQDVKNNFWTLTTRNTRKED
jgi:hypothetical protein